ncbi:MAG: DJ-1/PfpI family protein [Ruminococcaceae bacterium]|nr:DJ-1/PfpI family protein [Oscillospiraceae bacterium]
MTDNSVYVLLADGFEELEAIAPIDILRRMELNVVLVGVTSKQVRGSHGIELTADRTLNQLKNETPAAVMLPGGMPGTKNLDATRPVGELVRRVAADGGVVAAICAAPMVLGRLGLLDGKKATCYPGFEEHLHGAEKVADGVVVDGKFVTAAGAGVAADFGFAIGSLLKDPVTAAFVRRSMQFPDAL